VHAAILGNCRRFANEIKSCRVEVIDSLFIVVASYTFHRVRIAIWSILMQIPLHQFSDNIS